MRVRRILLISNHSLFREVLVRLLTDQLNVEIVEASTWEEGCMMFDEGQPPDAIVVGHKDLRLHNTDLAPLLWRGEQCLKVIYLTLSGDEMIVHHRERLENVSSVDLVQALRFPTTDRGIS